MDVKSVEDETFDEFREKLKLTYPITSSELFQDKIGKSSNWVTRLIFATLDPTGISPSLLAKCDEFILKNELDNIEMATYLLRKKACQYEKRLNLLEEKYLQEQVIPLTAKYLILSKDAYQRDKIEDFCNIWINGVLNEKASFGEKAYVFDLIASFRLEELLVLKIVNSKSLHIPSLGGSLSGIQPSEGFTHISEISRELKITETHAQQICLGLQGRGLLRIRATMGDLAGQTTPREFAANEYVDTIRKYLLEPHNGPC
jgi:hypothetical protein